MVPVTIVIADDHPVYRSGLRGELGDGFEVVAEAADAPSAITAIREHRPDVVACDVDMPGGGGLAVAAACADITRVVMLTVLESERSLLDAVAAGAVGYLLKTSDPDVLRSALKAAAAGEPVFSPSLASLVLGEFRRLANSDAEPLTRREREVLTLVARGYTYRQVGADLHISPRTAENHVRNILAKLHLARRDELIRYAADRRIT